MLDPLNAEAHQRLAAAHAGERWCYQPVTARDGYFGLAVAVEGRDGCQEVPLEDASATTYGEMLAHADALNAEMGLDQLDSARIIAATAQVAGDSAS